MATVFQYCVSHKKDAGTSSMAVQKDDEWLRAHEIERLREEFEQPGEYRIHQTKSTTGVVKHWSGSLGEVVKSSSLEIFNT